MFEEKVLKCQDCGREFTFSAKDQEFFAEKGYSQPLRCKECREKRRAQKDSGFGKSFDIICAKCGKASTVPFKPKSDQVYCRECYAEMNKKA